MRAEANPLLPARVFPANGWKIVEDINAAATFAAGQPPVLFRTRISDHQMDDVMVLNGSTGQLTVVQHPDVQPGRANVCSRGAFHTALFRQPAGGDSRTHQR